MAYVERLVRDGLAWRSEADDGVIEFTLSSGYKPRIVLVGVSERNPPPCK
jgi:hypothetical protein